MRYPVVELLVGAFCLALFLVELLSGGKNLPWRTPNIYAGVVWIIWFPKWDLIAIFAYHVMLLYVLLGMLLIRQDGLPIPRGLPAAGLVLGIVCPLAAPDVQVVPAAATVPLWFAGKPALLSAVTGLLAGAALGFVRAAALSSGRWYSQQSVTFALALVGTYLGWQAALSVALMTSIVAVLAAVAARAKGAFGRVSPLTCLWVCALVQILIWRRLSEVPYWPTHSAGFFSLLVACMATVGFSFLAGRIVIRRSEETPGLSPGDAPAGARPEDQSSALGTTAPSVGN